MPLHSLAASRALAPPSVIDAFVFDPELPRDRHSLLVRLLRDLSGLGLMPEMASCCGFCAELLAALLRRNGISAETIPCRVTIRVPEGVAYLGPGFARPGQIDAHFAVLTETMLIDWALGAARSLPALAAAPLGLALPRRPGAFAAAESRAGSDMQLLWEPADPGADAMRLHMAEKLKASRMLKRACNTRPRRMAGTHRPDNTTRLDRFNSEKEVVGEAGLEPAKA